MDVFPLPPPTLASINMISIRSEPWVLPPADQLESWGDTMLLSPAELNYIEIVTASAPPPLEPAPLSRALGSYVHSPWLGDDATSDPL